MSAIIWLTNKYRKNHQFDVAPLMLKQNETSSNIKQSILKMYEKTSKFSVRARNLKGHIIPIDSNLPTNTKLNPYVVEFFVPRVRLSSQTDFDLKLVCTFSKYNSIC
jgi:hypothetical protein